MDHLGISVILVACYSIEQTDITDTAFLQNVSSYVS